MKPIFQRLMAEPEEGFAFKAIRSAGFNCPWHMHPEYELILVLEGRGHRIVGDHMTALHPGDLVFVGPGLPHLWHEEPACPPPRVRMHLIQFHESFLGDGLLRLAALDPVRRLFRNAARGLHVTGQTRKKASLLMNSMAASKGLDRIVLFLQILGLLAHSKDCHPIASPGFASKPEFYDQERMNRVFQFLTGRIHQQVRLAEAARLLHLSEGAFSRFFRTHTGKTFPEFVNELRIGRACRLLGETEQNVTEVAFACGFTNLSNFNRQFLKLKGLSPRAFRRQVQERLPGGRALHRPN